MKRYLLLFSLLIHFINYSQQYPTESINKILRSHVSSASQPGLTIGVVKNNKLIYHNSIGYMQLADAIPFNDTTIFDLASVTKQFTSACIGILENQGKLSLDDDVRKYIPELAIYADTIRIKHLLNHTSGIRNHNVLLDLKGFDYQHQGYTNQMIQELMFYQKGVNNLPGEKMLYSNTNYVLLALIVERVSEMKIHAFAKQELFEPMEMKNSFYRSKLDEEIKNKAYPYYKVDDAYQQHKSLTLCVGAGGMESTVQDLAQWSRIFLDETNRLSYLGDFITKLDTLNNGTPMKHARGMFIDNYRNFKTLNHSGRDVGMRSQFICIPEKNLAVIIFTNSEEINATNISYQILDLFFTDTSTNDSTVNHYTHSAIELKKFVGVYQEMNSDLRMTIFMENDSLKAMSSLGNTPTPLVSHSKNTFCRTNNSSIKYSFKKGLADASDLNVDFGGAIFYFEKVDLALNPNQNLEDYVGNYYSEELHVTYSIRLENDNLILSYPNNENIVITEGVKDTFGSNRRTKYFFIRDNQGTVVSFKVAAEGTVKDILFNKTIE
ncbi:CubicO group peptidase, beta-lactamase class C family [Lishizhenia tianjinensis]|uniref:CubicO group peptidase, beta-lactamase class C family n=1 Tax=Lishizhenia tianjinensis TaxID=477690 RepID=A0A1I6XPF5_9FLAO|nr:serine hydrolase domain-containing protein [Lishizhenia tianjinensis]SFT39982.1 CubicO group peptidase, beta-lactamase class C family [Lishizhenia tianjinensis]